jgi:hypothetical protein
MILQSKNQFLFIVAIMGLMINFSACNNKNEVTPDKSTNNLDSVALQDISVLIDLYGFQRKNITITDKVYIVENDIIFDRDSFQSKYVPQTTVGGRHYFQYAIENQYRNIPVAIHSNVPDAWVVSLLEAMNVWNAENRTLKFYRVYNMSPEYGINVYYSSLSDPQTIAQSNAPYTGIPGNSLWINSTTSLSSIHETRVSALIHQLGHIIGFGHTDSDNSHAALNLPHPCSTEEDYLSVMRQKTSFRTSLSNCDKFAFIAKY